MTALIVDDDGLLRVALQRVLGCESRTADNIKAGLLVAAEWQPSVIILDVNFAGDEATGIDAIQAFHEACPRAQIVIMSAAYNGQDERAALGLGAFSYVSKGDLSLLCSVAWAARRKVTSLLVPGSPVLQ